MRNPKIKDIYWIGEVDIVDDFGSPIRDVFYDAKTLQGPWAIMSAASFRKHSRGLLGTGFGQKYVKQADGRWLKQGG